MVYLSGVKDHHIESDTMLDHIVRLVEERAAAIEREMSDAGMAEVVS